MTAATDIAGQVRALEEKVEALTKELRLARREIENEEDRRLDAEDDIHEAKQELKRLKAAQAQLSHLDRHEADLIERALEPLLATCPNEHRTAYQKTLEALRKI